MSTLDRSHCKGCGAEILWIKNENGKAEPFDARPARVLNVAGDRVPGGATFFVGNKGEPWADPDGKWELNSAHLPHFVTCPKAAQFRKPERGKP